MHPAPQVQSWSQSENCRLKFPARRCSVVPGCRGYICGAVSISNSFLDLGAGGYCNGGPSQLQRRLTLTSFGTSSQEFGVLSSRTRQTSLSDMRFTGLFLSVRYQEVRSSQCSVPVFVAAASSYAGHVATLSPAPMAKQILSQGTDAQAHLCGAWEDVCGLVLGPRGTPSHVHVITFR